MSYNVGFDFGKFLYYEPWNLRGIVERKIDLMKLASARVYELCEEVLLRIRSSRKGCLERGRNRTIQRSG